MLLSNQLELLYSIHNEIGAGPPFHKFFIILVFLGGDQNDIEFDLSIGHALIFFSVFMNNEQKM